MALPPGVAIRQVTFGPAFAIADGAPLQMKVTFTPSRSMVWNGTGAPGIAQDFSPPATTAGLSGSALLPVTDQVGWLDGLGNALSVGAGAQTHSYLVLVQYLDAAGRHVEYAPERSITLPTGDLSPVDLDILVPADTDEGVTVSIPDQWSQQLAAAQAAAQAAQAAVANAVLFQGIWAPGTFYAKNSLVSTGTGVYLAPATVPPRASFTPSDWVALSSSTAPALNYLTTETGDSLTTESGDLLYLDAA